MTDETPTIDWPPHRRAVRPWRQLHRAGTLDDRMLREVTVWLPPLVADRTLSLDSALAADLEVAMRQVTALDTAHDSSLRALGLLLLRTESVASSKIESVEAGLEEYARALHGIRANPSAVSMAAATTALESMIRDMSPGRPITWTTSRPHMRC